MVSERVRAELAKRERDVMWLSRATGIPYQRLWRSINRRQGYWRDQDVVKVAGVFDVTTDYLLRGVDAAEAVA